jgi:hypothetical protein
VAGLEIAEHLARRHPAVRQGIQATTALPRRKSMQPFEPYAEFETAGDGDYTLLFYT